MSGGGLVEVLRAHLPKDRYDDDGWYLGTVCTCGGWQGGYFADGEAGPFDLHLADVVTAHLAARLEGCREEVRDVMVSAVIMDLWTAEGVDLGRLTGRALAIVRSALELEVTA